MAENNKVKTIFQDLGTSLFYGFDKNVQAQQKTVHSYTINNDKAIYKTKDKDEYEKTKAQLKQEKYLANQWVSAGMNLSQTTALVANNLKLMYRDSDIMDGHPEIGAALDLYAEESCLFGDTQIKLLNGTILTIEELYNKNYKDFWVYSIDENGIDCKPTKIERVICNGIKPLMKITLDDGTELKTTYNHQLLLSNNNWIRTDVLQEGDSLMSIYDKKNYLGYEQIISTNSPKYILTHKMVAENILHDSKRLISRKMIESNEKYEKIVIHHKSFNKLNNDPDQLEYLKWSEHLDLHSKLNSDRWKNNPELAERVTKKFIEEVSQFWTGRKDELTKKRAESLRKHIQSLTQEERNVKNGRKAEKNGMYGVHRLGDKSPSYNHAKKHVSDIDESTYTDFVLNCKNKYTAQASEYFNMIDKEVDKYNKLLCEKYNIKDIIELKFKLDSRLKIKNIKEYILNTEKPRLKLYSDKNKISKYVINEAIKRNGYKSWNDIVKNVNNHRVVKIERIDEGLVYDLINSSNNNCFGVKCNTGLIISHNCTTNMKGQILNVTSNSERVKKILDDLFVNRLDAHINLPMWTRSMCKYGNAFVMLNVDDKNGVIGARQLPVYEIERVENGVYNPYVAVPTDYNKNRDTEFIWLGQSIGMPFKNWQIAHFRLLTDSLFLPYGVSILHKARRHFRILSMMEDMMLIYRLERSIERRVFKIYVGNIDDADIPAYVQEIANTFKRTPIIDPETGQLDLRKNMMDVSQDIFIPVKDSNASNPIDTLAAATNLDKIEDLKYIQNKVLTALRIPKEFLNFEEASGDGKNLALKDIRFTRTINRVQQALIMELTKIATIHLFLCGFTDELTNFKITMNNPSTQSEMLKLEELSKKIQLVSSALADPGNGIQIMSLTRAQREILGWTDAEITQNMLEIRFEKALAAELAKTEQIIKRTGLFDAIDKIYGEPDAEYSASAMGEEGPGGSPGGGGGGFGDSFGSELGGEEPEGLSTEEPNSEGMPTPEAGGPEGGTGETPNTANTENNAQSAKLESIKKKIDKLLIEHKGDIKEVRRNRTDKYLTAYLNHINNHSVNSYEKKETIIPIVNEAFIKNQETNDLIIMLDEKIKKY